MWRSGEYREPSLGKIGKSEIYEFSIDFGFFDFFIAVLGPGRGSIGFPDPVGSILAEYGPERTDGDPIYPQNYYFCHFSLGAGLVGGCKSCLWVQLLSLGASLVVGCNSCLWVQLLSLDASLVVGCKSCRWVQVLSLGATLVVGCKSCRWVQVLSWGVMANWRMHILIRTA